MTESSLSPSEPVALPDRPFGRARGVLAHALVTALMLVARIVAFVPAMLFHCAIRHGRKAAWLMLLASVTLAAAWIAAAPSPSAAALNERWVELGSAVLAIALPSMAALPLIERGEKFGRVLMFLVIGGAAGLALTEAAGRALLSFSPYEAQIKEMHASKEIFAEFYRANNAPPEKIAALDQAAKFMTFVLPGVQVLLIAFTFIISLMMLGRMPAWRDHAAKRGDAAMHDVYAFRNFKLPDWLLFAFILGGLTPLLTGVLQKAAGSTLLVVAFLYLLQGLAVFRSLLISTGAGLGGILLACTILAVLTLMRIAPLMLAVAGLFDSFFDFRNYKKRKDDSDESHSD